MELERFKRRLIKRVARHLLNDMPEEKVWEDLRQHTGFDCHGLWLRIRALTLKKLKRLVDAEDKVIDVDPPARMTYTDWLLLDRVMVHEDVDLTENMSVANQIRLFELVLRHDVEAFKGDDLAEAWTVVTFEYNTDGRQCSPMLLQRRWYQLKAATRECFYRFWYAYKGNPRLLEKALEIKPNQIQAEIARWYPQVILRPWLSWDQLLKDKSLTMPDEFERKIKAKCAAIREETNKSKISADTTADDDDVELVLVEPRVETIDLADEPSDTLPCHVTKVDKTSTKQPSTNIGVEEKPKDNISKTSLIPAILVRRLNERDTKLLNNFLRADGEEDCVNTMDEFSDEIADIVSPSFTETVVKREIGSEIVKSERVILENSISNNMSNSDTDMNCPNAASIDNIKLIKEQDRSSPIYGNIHDTPDKVNIEGSLRNSHNVSNCLDAFSDKNIQIIEEQDTSSMHGNVEEAVDEVHIDVILGKDHNYMDCVNVTSDENKIIGEQDTTSLMHGNIHETANEIFEIDLVTEYGSKVDADNKNMESDEIDATSQIKTEYYEDDDDDMEDDLIYCNPDSMSRESPSKEREIVEIDSQEHEAYPVIDAKLLMNTVVYTTKLDKMCVFRNSNINKVCNKDILEQACIESKPILKSNVNSKIVTQENAYCNDELKNDICNVMNPENIEFDDLPEDLKIDISDTIFQKPYIYKYNPVQFCKNPDFNTRLKRLTVGFTSLPRNREFLKILKPLTIDLTKSFEDKLIHGTIFFKSSGTARNVNNASTVSSSLQIAQNITQQLSPMEENQEETAPTEMQVLNATNVNNATPVSSSLQVAQNTAQHLSPMDENQETAPIKMQLLNLPETDDTFKMNRHVRMVEVGPIKPSVNNSCEPPVRLVLPPKISDESQAHVKKSTKFNNSNESNNRQQIDVDPILTENKITSEDDSCRSVNKGVNIDQKDVAPNTNLQKRLKCGPKSKLKPRYTYTIPRIMSCLWSKDTKSTTSKISALNEILLTVDALHKMLCVTDNVEEPNIDSKDKKAMSKNKKKSFGRLNDLRTRLEYFENISEEYKNCNVQNKTFIKHSNPFQCYSWNSKSTTTLEKVDNTTSTLENVNNTTTTSDTKGTTKKKELPKERNEPRELLGTTNSKVRPIVKKIRNIDIEKYCCWSKIKLFNQQYRGKHKCSRICVCCCRYELFNSKQKLYKNIPTNIYCQRLKKISKGEQFQEVPIRSNAEIQVIKSGIGNDQLPDLTISKKVTKVHPKINIITGNFEKSNIISSIPFQNQDSRVKEHKNIELPCSKSIQCDLDKINPKHSDNIEVIEISDENTDSIAAVTKEVRKKTQPMQDDHDKILHTNTMNKSNTEVKTPIFVGRNQILLTNENSPEAVHSENNKITAKEPTVSLAKRVLQVEILPKGHSTCALQPNTCLSSEQIMNLPDVLEAVKNQLPQQNRKIIIKKKDVGNIKVFENYDDSLNFKTQPITTKTIQLNNDVRQFLDISTVTSGSSKNIEEQYDLITNKYFTVSTNQIDQQEKLSSYKITIDPRSNSSNYNEMLDETNQSDQLLDEINASNVMLSADINNTNMPELQHTSNSLETMTDQPVTTTTISRPIRLIRKRKIIFPKHNTTLISDLMAMSGISDEDVKSVSQAPLSSTEVPIAMSSSAFNRVFAHLKDTCQDKRKFYKLNLDTGYVTNVSLSIKRSDVENTNTQPEVVDLTDDVELEENKSYTRSISDRERGSLLDIHPLNPTMIPINQSKSCNILNDKSKIVSNVAVESIGQDLNGNGDQLIHYIQNPSEAVLGDFEIPFREVTESDSSDDEPLSMKSKRMRIEEKSNRCVEQSEELAEAQNVTSSIVEEIDLMSDEDCILGV